MMLTQQDVGGCHYTGVVENAAILGCGTEGENIKHVSQVWAGLYLVRRMDLVYINTEGVWFHLFPCRW